MENDLIAYYLLQMIVILLLVFFSVILILNKMKPFFGEKCKHRIIGSCTDKFGTVTTCLCCNSVLVNKKIKPKVHLSVIDGITEPLTDFVNRLGSIAEYVKNLDSNK